MAHLSDPRLLAEVDAARRHFGLDAFVETGTGNGISLEAAYPLFVLIYSCDIEADRIVKVRNTLPGALLYISDSLTFLEGVLPKLNTPTFFWLDAHGPDFPAYEELLRIKTLKRGYEHDVIWFDDFDKPDHLGRHVLSDYINVLAGTHVWLQVDGIVRFTPRG